MGMITMVAPAGVFGQVQTEYGTFLIDTATSLVVVDRRCLRQLEQAGFILYNANAVSPANVTAMIGSALAAMIGVTAPKQETAKANAGTATSIAAGDHSHARLSEVISGSLGSGGSVRVDFAKQYSVTPGLTFLSIGAGKAVTFDFAFDQPDAQTGIIKGGVLSGKTRTVLPTLTAILTDILKLSGFDPFSSAAANVGFTGFAIRSAADPITG